MAELVIEYPSGSVVYIPSELIDVQLPGMTVLKLKDVVVDESALLHVLENHRRALNVVELDSVSLVMTEHMSECLASRTYYWTNIIGYLRNCMSLSKVRLSSLSWHDENEGLITNRYLETVQAKYHEKWFDPDVYWKLSRRRLQACGSHAVKAGLEKLLIEVHKKAGIPRAKAVEDEVDGN